MADVALIATDPPVLIYAGYYDNKEIDTFDRDYGGVMADYVLDGGGALSADKLAESVNTCAAQQIPTAFLVLGTRPGVPTVQCCHRLTQFQPQMGLVPSQWDNIVFAFSDDIINGQMLTVQWDRAMYEPVSNNSIVVGTQTLVAEMLATDPSIH